MSIKIESVFVSFIKLNIIRLFAKINIHSPDTFTNMSFPNNLVRTYNQNDKNPLLSYLKGQKASQTGNTFLQKIMEKGLQKPGYSVEKDLFLAWEKGRIVGWMNVFFESHIQRAVLSGYSRTTKNSADSLLELSIERAGELEAKKVHVYLPEKNNEARKFFINHGFVPVRTFLEMTIDFSKTPESANNISGPYDNHFKPGEEEQLAGLQNICFEGSWDFNPNTTEDIRFWLALTGTKIEDVIVEKKAKEFLGYCWNHLVLPDVKKASKKKGRIYMVGVHPAHRGLGIGKKLVRSGLSLLKAKDVQLVGLTVDETNVAGKALYASLGFSLNSRNLWFEKHLKD
ncbi:MAG: GNAT family N-acetyltransferase [Candidatus Aminicenantes bacterium]|nr:GNAT family N-acetyltransferase [Candidatus Aminicenantes bacterium]